MDFADSTSVTVLLILTIILEGLNVERKIIFPTIVSIFFFLLFAMSY